MPFLGRHLDIDSRMENLTTGLVLGLNRLFWVRTVIVGQAVDVLWVSTGFFVRVIDMAVAL
jgi:hypothetical protein